MRAFAAGYVGRRHADCLRNPCSRLLRCQAALCVAPLPQALLAKNPVSSVAGSSMRPATLVLSVAFAVLAGMTLVSGAAAGNFDANLMGCSGEDPGTCPTATVGQSYSMTIYLLPRDGGRGEDFGCATYHVTSGEFRRDCPSRTSWSAARRRATRLAMAGLRSPFVASASGEPRIIVLLFNKSRISVVTRPAKSAAVSLYALISSCAALRRTADDGRRFGCAEMKTLVNRTPPERGLTAKRLVNALLIMASTPPEDDRHTRSRRRAALPPGLTLDSPTGKIAGTGTTAGRYPFTVTVTDGTGAMASVECEHHDPAVARLRQGQGPARPPVSIASTPRASPSRQGLGHRGIRSSPVNPAGPRNRRARAARRDAARGWRLPPQGVRLFDQRRTDQQGIPPPRPPVAASCARLSCARIAGGREKGIVARSGSRPAACVRQGGHRQSM